jgi:hypothetical protein
MVNGRRPPVFHTGPGAVFVVGHWEIDGRFVLITKQLPVSVGEPPVLGLLVVDRDSGELL